MLTLFNRRNTTSDDGDELVAIASESLIEKKSNVFLAKKRKTRNKTNLQETKSFKYKISII